VLGKLFRKRQAEAAPAPEPTPEPPPESVFDTGLIDMVRSGWFNNDSGELYPDFPVGPEDIVVDVGCGDGFSPTSIHVRSRRRAGRWNRWAPPG